VAFPKRFFQFGGNRITREVKPRQVIFCAAGYEVGWFLYRFAQKNGLEDKVTPSFRQKEWLGNDVSHL